MPHLVTLHRIVVQLSSIQAVYTITRPLFDLQLDEHFGDRIMPTGEGEGDDC